MMASMLRVLTALALCLAPQDGAVSNARWTHVVDWMRAESAVFAADLSTARETLLARAEREAPELADALRDSPAPAVERGYGVLPRLLVDAEPADVEPRRQTYSLEGISTAYAWAFRDAAVLARTAGDGDAPLAELVAEYERLHAKHVNLEEHIAYHAYWQAQATAEPEFFAERNAVLAHVEQWSRVRGGADTELAARLRTLWTEKLAPFTPTPGLKLERRGDALVLPVTVTTDVADDAFLAAFAAAVDEAYNAAPAARGRGFRLELVLERAPPASLYPDGPPARGAEIDEDQHCARFPAGALVLTTGAASTHSFVGRSIVLGADPLPPRTLAHELGHLLGFRDAYLRGFEGDPADRFGVTFVEWTGLLDSLMGDSRRGLVTAEMVERLIDAYGD